MTASTRRGRRILLGSGLVLAIACALATVPEARGRQAPADAARQYRATIDQYCAGCHNQRVLSGGLALDRLDPANVAGDAEAWEKVVRKLRVGLMPPQGVRRPDRATYDALIAWLERELDAAAAGRPAAGRQLLRRLNRAEYANAVRDLLGLDVDVAALLPPDDAAFGFDNVADAQANSPALLQAYLAAARKISALAIGDARVGVDIATYSARQDLSQDTHLDGMPLGTVGGLSARHVFPIDGEYDFQVRLYRSNLNAIRGLEDPHRFELTIDGERVLLATIGGESDLVPLQQNPTAASDALESSRLRVRAFVKAGAREIGAAFIEEVSPRLETNRLQRFIRDFSSPYDAEGAPHVRSVTVEGPYDARPSSQPPSSRIFICRPSAAGDEAACARRILTTIARRAYRREPSAQELSELMAFYARQRPDAGFNAAIGFALRRVLASPSFVFRPETEPAGVRPGEQYAVSDEELASRLSFFLWSTIPDDELLRLAAARQLRRPATLERQVRRMLADPRADAFVANFAGQWLHLRNLRGITPNSDLYPDFDDNLRQAFRREAELFFASILREDRSVLDLMTADYTFVDERLARHYGLNGVFGSEFRRVHLDDERRHGLLGKGAILLATSHANTTSPVLRGKWVLENILGSPPPPPPPDVPALQEKQRDEPRTMREQIERHRASPACAGCHRMMDPIGFALENFDVVGAWRRTSEDGLPLDTADVLTTGARVDGVVALRRALLDRPDVFVQTLTEKMMIYALGRGLTHEDAPTVRAILRDARQRDYRFSELVLGIVRSQPFLSRRKELPSS